MKTRKAFFICLFLVAGGSILILLNTLLLTGTQNNWFRGKHLSIVRTVKGDSYSRRANTATDHNVSSQSSTSNAVLSNDKSGNGVEKVWSSNYNNDTIVSPQNQINTSSDDSGLKVVSGYLSVLDDQPLKMNCKTCSLVSNSGRILGQKKGSEIDEADCVFRMNHAPVEGFKNDVGQKTTARVVCQIGVLEVLPQVKQHTLPKFFIVWGGPHLSDHTTMKYRQLVKTAQMYPQMGIYRSIDEYDDYQDSLFRNETGRGRIKSGSWLSTGWFSIALMKQVCQRIQIYGMIPANYCRNRNTSPALYHYWEHWIGDECNQYRTMEYRARGAHRFMSEKTIFARWALKYNITFHSPSWNPKDYASSTIMLPRR